MSDDVTKVAIVRCERISEACAGYGCLTAFNDRRVKFEEIGDAELVGFFTCGGCPGRRIKRLVKKLQSKDRAPDVIHLSSCMLYDEEQDYISCPAVDEIERMIESMNIKVERGTHH
ncbi:putative metal-binding protein [Methanonatronarchaeum thermophilum]|uniref:Putative metal-binding protein n=1 Tax=Methanonatronarchaeum thermophilum TaxID=1927129 RepID=A0A1Y3GAA1_9EURY|nr:CGGC domain-containing protein [Methanonatronarchaeum thermophilum]OUJ18358.1 putative metal-binding protein [Methanonatronarchaeum thermophilum]